MARPRLAKSTTFIIFSGACDYDEHVQGLSLLPLIPSHGRLRRFILKLPLTQRRHALVIVLHVKGDPLGQSGVAFAPLVDGLEHAARVLDVPKDAAVGCALVGVQALEPVRVPLPPILIRDGVVLVPPGLLVRARRNQV